MTDVVWSDRPDLKDPVLVCAFKGWNDAGEAASAALGPNTETIAAATNSATTNVERA